MQLSISRKLMAGNVAGCMVLLSVIGVFAFFSTLAKSRARFVRDEAGVYVLKAMEMQYHVVQVQQWLTDISATRGLDGLDDGYKLAEEHAAEFTKRLDEFQKYYREREKTRQLKQLAEVRAAFGPYYDCGKRMAAAFIAEGPAGGNKLMGEFDAAASALVELLSPFVDDHRQQFVDATNESVSIAGRSVLIGSLFGLCGAVVSLLVSGSISRDVSRSLKSTMAAFRNIAEGDGDLTRRLDESRTDELGQMARSANAFLSTVQSIVAKIAQDSATLDSASTTLGRFADQLHKNSSEARSQSLVVSSASEQMSSNMRNMTDAASNVRANVEQVADAVQQMTVSIQEIARNAGQAAQNAHDAMAATEVGRDEMRGLGTVAENIGQVVAAIQDIAAQTNLLALNATIEAARAGEAGKGFSVVATEVKELAKQTAAATEDIRARIEDIQHASGTAVEAMSKISSVIEAVNAVNGSIAAAAEEQSAISRGISENVAHSADAVHEMSQQLEQIAQASQEIAVSIVNVDHSVESTLTVAESTKASGEELCQLATLMHDTVAKFHA
jgi:methyl-accepting chemotaxis protein